VDLKGTLASCKPTAQDRVVVERCASTIGVMRVQ